MKSQAIALVLGLSMFIAGCASSGRYQHDNRTMNRTVEAGCATCMFEMPGVEGCVLAVRIEGKPYLVKGSEIDDHGDAHAADGFCNAVRQAHVEGRIENDTFMVTKMELLP